MRYIALILALLPFPAFAGPLDGKSYIIELSSSQYDSGYGNYLLPPLVKALKSSGMTDKRGPGADVVVNIQTDSDVGRWVTQAGQKVWIYTISATVGISPETYAIPYEGTPAFGVRAVLQTPNPDRQDEMDCLIGLAARTAIAGYRLKGHFDTDGGGCLRQ